MDNNDVHLNVFSSGGVWQKMCYCGKLKYCHMVGKLQTVYVVIKSLKCLITWLINDLRACP